MALGDHGGLGLKDRYGLLQRGLFPETLPPCFTSKDIKRALVGLVRELNSKNFHKRPTDYVRYSGTKHDGSRRYFGSPNPISYFFVADFIANNWQIFEERFAKSPFSVSQPKIASESDDRPIVIQSLSELTTVASRKLRYSSHILKADISQFFPSVYTHSIAWSAHGIDAAKIDQDPKSKKIHFNELDLHVRNCQLSESRGILVGPDAFRLIAEFIAAGIDSELDNKIKQLTVGVARHVDDYYIGLKAESDALIALSALRDTLQRFSLNINDNKTKIMVGTEPLNDLWAQELRATSRDLRGVFGGTDISNIILFISKSIAISHEIKSDSPIKIALRTMDQIKIYQSFSWGQVEPYLQRIMFHHSHCVDYVALIVVKRIALGKEIDRDGWKELCYTLIERHLALNHHHEVVWLTWLLLSSKIDITERVVTRLAENPNAHIRALVIAAYLDGRIAKKPPIGLGGKLPTTDNNWLVNLVAKAGGYTGASFSGLLASEFDHLAKKKIKLIDLKSHLSIAKNKKAHAISRTRYGYDGDDYEEDDDDFLNIPDD